MFIADFADFINTYAKKYRPKLVFLVLSTTIAGCFEFAGLSLIWAFVLLLTKNSSNIAFFHNTNQTQTALFLGILVAGIYILKDIFMIIHINFQNRLLEDIINNIFKKIYSGFISQNYLTIRNIPPSDKLKILDTSLNYVVNDFAGGVLMLFANSIVALGIISYLFIKFNSTAIIIAAFIFTVWFFENRYFKSRSKVLGDAMQAAERNKADFTLSTLNAQKDIIIYNKRKIFSDEAQKLQKIFSKQRRKIRTNLQIPTFVTEIGVMAAFVLFVVLMLLNNRTNAELGAGLAALAAIILRITPNINKIQNCFQLINATKAELKWFNEVTSKFYVKTASFRDTDEKFPFKNLVELENVTFCYEKNKPVLKNIDLKINKNEFIGIIGPSGSGKTTLFNLLCALFEPNSGKVKIDGVILNPNMVKMWQNNISILSQDYALPFKTIGQNVTLEPNFDINKDKKDIIEALKFANIYDEIQGDIEKNVNELSCGQRHRIALARVFYFKRNVIMLDEATSALDVQTEDEISKTVEAIKGKKTIIAIAHRLKTLKNCDRLIYMDNGKILGVGTFKELEDKFPEFKKLIKLSQF